MCNRVYIPITIQSAGYQWELKMCLGEESNLRIVILCFDYLTLYKVILNPSKKRLNHITSSLLWPYNGITIISSQRLELK